MQTFLRYESFRQSAECLDNKRLGKQRVVAYQILNTLVGNSIGWINHPAVQMWEGSEDWLYVYIATCCQEWIKRGFKDSILDKCYLLPINLISNPYYPLWLGNPQFHASHRSNLLRKDPIHYSQFGWTEPNDLPYYWPTKELVK